MLYATAETKLRNEPAISQDNAVQALDLDTLDSVTGGMYRYDLFLARANDDPVAAEWSLEFSVKVTVKK